jgi:hypothetical protein
LLTLFIINLKKTKVTSWELEKTLEQMIFTLSYQMSQASYQHEDWYMCSLLLQDFDWKLPNSDSKILACTWIQMRMWGRRGRGRGRLTVGFTTNYTISIYHIVSSNPSHAEMYRIKHYMIKFVSDLWQVGSFLVVLRFPLPIKLPSTI